MPGDRDRYDRPPHRYRISDCERTGHFNGVAPWAVCGRSQTRFSRYSSLFVGGGAAVPSAPGLSLLGANDDVISMGRSRKCNGCGKFGEGTWGLVYRGFAEHTMVCLKNPRGLKA